MNKEPPDKYRTKKLPINKIIVNDIILEKINGANKRVNKLRINVNQFIELYSLKQYHNNLPIPTINKKFVSACLKVLCKKAKAGNNPSGKKLILYNDLKKFYNEEYSKLNYGKIDGVNLSGILNYLETEIVTNFENNIRMHFIDYIKRFINISFKDIHNNILDNFKGKERTEKHKLLRRQLKLIESDLMNNTKNCDKLYHKWLETYRNKILPDKKAHSYLIDISTYPQKYVPYMIFMNMELENKGRKMFRVFPLTTEIIPKYMAIDSKAIVELLIESNKNEYLSNIRKYKKDIWKLMFKMNHESFKMKNYTFDYKISTDGYAISLQFINNKYISQEELKKDKKVEGSKQSKINNKNKSIEEIEKERTNKEENIKQLRIQKRHEFSKLVKQTAEKEKLIPKPKKVIEFPYLDELNEKELESVYISNKVYIDPGKRDLLTMMDENGVKMKYSNKERLFKTKRLKYQKIIERYKKKHKMDRIEYMLSLFNSKTCDYEKFKEYVYYKNFFNSMLVNDYRNKIFRQYKWYAYINTKRSENELVNNIAKKFGRNITIIMGDWSIGKQMRGFISTPNIGLKRKLNEHFDVYNLDEYRTSLLNNITEEKCDNLYLPDKSGIQRKLHSVLTFQMSNKRIGCINRDWNSVKNMRKIVDYWFTHRERPLKFRRDYNLEENGCNPCSKEVSNATKPVLAHLIPSTNKISKINQYKVSMEKVSQKLQNKKIIKCNTSNRKVNHIEKSFKNLKRKSLIDYENI